MFFVNCVFKNDMFLLFSRIYDVIKLIVMTCFLLIAYLKMTCFYYFHGFEIIVMTCFLLIAYLKMTCFYYFHGFEIIVMTCFLLIAYLKMTCFLLFSRIRNNCDDMFFVNCVFKNVIFRYILLYHFYQSNY